MKWLVILLIFDLLLQIGCSKTEQKDFAKNVANLEKPQISQSNVTTNKQSEFGYVPDEQTAIEIAVKVWIPIYGKEQIEDEKPYRATLKNGIWTVSGSLSEGWDGGVAMAQTLQKDGKILKVIHGK